MEAIGIKSKKAKFYASIILFIIGILVVYQLSFKVTFEKYSDNMWLSNQVVQYEAQLTAEFSTQNQKGKFNFSCLDADSIHIARNRLFDVLNGVAISNNIQVQNFSDHSSFKEEQYLIETLLIELSGDYPSLLKSLNVIEQDQHNFKVNSALFSKHRNIKTRKDELILSIYFQTLVKDE